MSSDQYLGRKRTVSVVQADGTTVTTTLQTVGIGKPNAPTKAAETPQPEPVDPPVPAKTPVPAETPETVPVDAA